MMASRPGRGVLARQLVSGIAVAIMLPILAGCQKSLAVSALNRCGRAIEARADSVPETSVGWSSLEPGQRDNLVAVPDEATTLYVDVRSSDDQTPTRFVVSVAALPEPPKGVDDDVENVLAGDRCPAAASYRARSSQRDR
jgi:hypothetical protein